MNISSNNIEIRKVRCRDLNRLGNMFVSAFGDEMNTDHIRRRIIKIRQLYPLLRPLASISPWVRNLFNFYVIRVNGNIAGFLQLSYVNSTQLHLDYIAIDKAFQSQGIGERVLRKLIVDAKAGGVSEIVLEVKSDNTAFRLYRRLNFSTQTRILHYSRWLGDSRVSLVSPKIPGLRQLRPVDRAPLFPLKRSSIPERLQQYTLHVNQRRRPSLFIRNLEWLKDRMMKKEKREYVVERDGKIAAFLEIYSYSPINNHMITLIVHPQHEDLRSALMQYAVYLLQSKYKKGKVTTTVYDDASYKSKALEKAGFQLQAVYYLMARNLGTEGKLTLPQVRYHSDALYKAGKNKGAVIVGQFKGAATTFKQRQ